MSPTARSTQLLRQSGYLVEPVERWIPGTQIRKDFLGCGDLLAIAAHREPKFLLVQATTGDHLAHRLTKAKALTQLRVWLQAGGSFEAHGWGRRDGRWQVRRVEVKLGDLDLVTVAPPRSRRRRQSIQPELFPTS